MTYARIKTALRKCCGYHDEEESLSSDKADVQDEKVQTKLNLQDVGQLKECFAHFNGNWDDRLARGALPGINAQLNDYLMRYHEEKGVAWLTAVSATGKPLIDATTTVLHFHRAMQMPEWHTDHFAVSSTLDSYYNAAVYASCLVYFANSVDELVKLHQDTMRKFQHNLDNSFNLEWRKLTVPPIFLVVTDKNSILHHPETLEKLAALSIPILHAIYVPSSELDIMTHTKHGDYVNNLFWQSLIKYTIAPCYEKLAVVAGLIKEERLPLENHIIIEKNGSWESFITVEFDDSSDSDEDVAEMAQEVSSEPVEKQSPQQVMPANASTALQEEKVADSVSAVSDTAVTVEEAKPAFKM